MTNGSRKSGPTNRGMVAGSLLVSPTILFGLIGLGVGSLVGGAVLLTLLGVFVGAGIGLALVIGRFRDL